MADERGPGSLSECLDANEHRRALVGGLREWHAFVHCCLDRSGPAGVAHRGASDLAAKLRAEAEATTPESATLRAFGIVSSIADARMQMASSHLAATATLLADVDALPSVPAVVRAWTEASARTLWLIDPAITGHEMAERALTEILTEGERLGRALGLNGGSFDEVVAKVAASAGAAPKRKIPPALHLIRRYVGAGVGEIPDWHVAWTYNRGSGAVHSSGLAWWLSTIGDSEGLDVQALDFSMTDILQGLALHVAAVKAWTSLHDWSPRRLFEQCHDVALVRACRPFMDLDLAAKADRERRGI